MYTRSCETVFKLEEYDETVAPFLERALSLSPGAAASGNDHVDEALGGNANRALLSDDAWQHDTANAKDAWTKAHEPGVVAVEEKELEKDDASSDAQKALAYLTTGDPNARAAREDVEVKKAMAGTGGILSAAWAQNLDAKDKPAEIDDRDDAHLEDGFEATVEDVEPAKTREEPSGHASSHSRHSSHEASGKSSSVKASSHAKASSSHSIHSSTSSGHSEHSSHHASSKPESHNTHRGTKPPEAKTGKKESSSKESSKQSSERSSRHKKEASSSKPVSSSKPHRAESTKKTPAPVGCTWADVRPTTLQRVIDAYKSDFEELGYAAAPPDGSLDFGNDHRESAFLGAASSEHRDAPNVFPGARRAFVKQHLSADGGLQSLDDAVAAMGDWDWDAASEIGPSSGWDWSPNSNYDYTPHAKSPPPPPFPPTEPSTPPTPASPPAPPNPSPPPATPSVPQLAVTAITYCGDDGGQENAPPCACPGGAIIYARTNMDSGHSKLDTAVIAGKFVRNDYAVDAAPEEWTKTFTSEIFPDPAPNQPKGFWCVPRDWIPVHTPPPPPIVYTPPPEPGGAPPVHAAPVDLIAEEAPGPETPTETQPVPAPTEVERAPGPESSEMLTEPEREAMEAAEAPEESFGPEQPEPRVETAAQAPEESAPKVEIAAQAPEESFGPEQPEPEVHVAAESPEESFGPAQPERQAMEAAESPDASFRTEAVSEADAPAQATVAAETDDTALAESVTEADAPGVVQILREAESPETAAVFEEASAPAVVHAADVVDSVDQEAEAPADSEVFNSADQEAEAPTEAEVFNSADEQAEAPTEAAVFNSADEQAEAPTEAAVFNSAATTEVEAPTEAEVVNSAASTEAEAPTEAEVVNSATTAEAEAPTEAEVFNSASQEAEAPTEADVFNSASEEAEAPTEAEVFNSAATTEVEAPTEAEVVNSAASTEAEAPTEAEVVNSATTAEAEAPTEAEVFNSASQEAEAPTEADVFNSASEEAEAPTEADVFNSASEEAEAPAVPEVQDTTTTVGTLGGTYRATPKNAAAASVQNALSDKRFDQTIADTWGAAEALYADRAKLFAQAAAAKAATRVRERASASASSSSLGVAGSYDFEEFDTPRLSSLGRKASAGGAKASSAKKTSSSTSLSVSSEKTPSSVSSVASVSETISVRESDTAGLLAISRAHAMCTKPLGAAFLGQTGFDEVIKRRLFEIHWKQTSQLAASAGEAARIGMMPRRNAPSRSPQGAVRNPERARLVGNALPQTDTVARFGTDPELVASYKQVANALEFAKREALEDARVANARPRVLPTAVDAEFKSTKKDQESLDKTNGYDPLRAGRPRDVEFDGFDYDAMTAGVSKHAAWDPTGSTKWRLEHDDYGTGGAKRFGKRADRVAETREETVARKAGQLYDYESPADRQ